MKKTLEALWYEYQMELSEKPSEEEKKILHTLVAAEDKLLAELSGEQTRTLKVLEDCLAIWSASPIKKLSSGESALQQLI